MNEQTRYRITGSLFVVALAIIFLPMLFDGAGVRDLKLPVKQSVPNSSSKQFPETVSTESFARAESLAEKIQQRQKTSRIGEVEVTPVSSKNSIADSASSWGVQLGSFSTEANAKKLKAQLEKSKYNVVLSRAKTTDGTITRVVIGPLIRESDAIKLRQRLSKTYREPIVVKLAI